MFKDGQYFRKKMTQPEEDYGRQDAKRGPKWRATKDHAVCSKHFKDWCQGPSPSHPDPELFEYNQWGSTKNITRSSRTGDTKRRRTEPDTTNSSAAPSDKENIPPSVLKADYFKDIEEVQGDIHVEVDSSSPTSATVSAGM